MKATELMVGDWVRIAPYDIIDQVDCLLTEYAVTSHGDTYGQYEYKDIEPILLTGEILKSNGFELVEIGDNGPSTPKANVNRYENWECKTAFQTFCLIYDRRVKKYSLNAFSNHIINIMYVHELQNAMRVCGVEKEIEL